MRTARAEFARGRPEQAATTYRRALSRARAIDDPTCISDAAYNLAACLTCLDEHEQARPFLREAKAEVGRTQGNTTHIVLLEAKVASRQGKDEEAVALLEKLTALPAQSLDRIHRTEIHLLKGHLACDRANVPEARSQSRSAVMLAEDIDDPSVRANVAGLAGRAHMIAKEYGPAAREFDAEVGHLREACRYADMVQALERAGEAHLASNDEAAAAERFFRAARSTFAQGNISKGLKLADRATAAAKKVDGPELLMSIRAIRDEILSASTAE